MTSVDLIIATALSPIFKPEVFNALFSYECGDDVAAADVDLDARHDRTVLHFHDPSLELIACAELHVHPRHG